MVSNLKDKKLRKSIKNHEITDVFTAEFSNIS
jgi:hypothetical protein